MRKLYTILLIMMLPILASGQRFEVKNGQYVVRYGSFVKKGGTVSVPDIPDPPEDIYTGDTYYVATTGDNGDPGTLSEPWADVSYAVGGTSAMASTDIVYVKAGGYGAESIVLEIDSIAIIGYKTTPGDQPKFNWNPAIDNYDPGETPYYDGNDRNGGDWFDFNEQPNCLLKNFQCTEWSNAIVVTGRENTVQYFYGGEFGWPEFGEDPYSPFSGIRLDGSTDSINSRSPVAPSNKSLLSHCIMREGVGIGFSVWSDSCIIRNCKMYQSTGTTSGEVLDYYFSVMGNDNLIDSCKAWRIGDLEHLGHGFGVKGSWKKDKITGASVDMRGNVFSHDTAYNMTLEAFWFRHHNVTENIIEYCHAEDGAQHFVFGDGAHDNIMRYSSGNNSRHPTNVTPSIQFRDGSEDQEGETGINNLMHHMVISNAESAIGFMEGYTGTTNTEGNKFHNMVFYNCDYFFSHMQTDNTDNEFVNCIISDMDNDAYSWPEVSNVTYTYTDFYNNISFSLIDQSDPSNITTNPLFTDAANGDFTLEPSSNAIDAGLYVGLPYSGTAPDMGAKEPGEPLAFEDVAIVIEMIDFSDKTVGIVATKADIASAYTNSVGYDARSNSWGANAPSIYHPHWANFSWDSSGYNATGVSLDLTTPEDYGNCYDAGTSGYYTAANLNILYDSATVAYSEDTIFYDRYYASIYVDTAQAAWGNTSGSDEWKLNHMWAGYKVWGTGDTDDYNKPPTYGPAGGFSYNKHGIMGEGESGDVNSLQTYNNGEYLDRHWTQGLPNPDSLPVESVWLHDHTQQLAHAEILRGVMYDSAGTYGYYEYFIDGVFSRRIEVFPDDWPVTELRGDSIVMGDDIFWDGLNIKFHPGGSCDEVFTGSAATVRVGPQIFFGYDPAWSGAMVGQRSEIGRELVLPESFTKYYKLQERYEIVGIGNSLYNNSYEAYDKLNDMIRYSVENLADPGDKISTQEGVWNTHIGTLSQDEIDDIDYVLIGVGINDINDDVDPYSGILTDYQGLVDQVQSDCPNAQIICSTLTPCKGSDPQDATDYQQWLDFNSWMTTTFAAAEPTVQIMTTNTIDLNDGSDNLHPTYDNDDGIHVNGDGGTVMFENLRDAINN